ERGEVSEDRTLRVHRPRVLDVAEEGDLPVEVGFLLRAMPHTEPSAVPAAPVGGESSIAHQRAEDDLKLLVAQQLLLRDQDPVTGDEFACLAPAARRADEVVLRRGELGHAILL